MNLDNNYLVMLYRHAHQAFDDDITIVLDARDYTMVKFIIRHHLSSLDAATCMNQFWRIHTLHVPEIVITFEWAGESEGA